MRFLSHYMNPVSLFRLDAASDGGAGGGGSAAASTGAPSTGTPASSATTGTTSASSTGTTPTTAAQTPTAATDGIEDGNWKAVRERLAEAQKRTAVIDQLEGYSEADLPVAWKQFSAMRTESSTLAKELGYYDAELKEAFDQDPVATLALLRSEKAQAGRTSTQAQTRQTGETQAEFEARIQAAVDKTTKPYTEHINRQISDAVEKQVGVEFQKAYDAVLPNTPPEVREMVEDYLTDYLIANPNLIVAMKARNDYSSIDTTVRAVAGRLQSVFQKWVAHESSRTGSRTSTSTRPAPVSTGKGSGPGGKITLDDMINNPGLLGDQYA